MTTRRKLIVSAAAATAMVGTSQGSRFAIDGTNGAGSGGFKAPNLEPLVPDAFGTWRAAPVGTIILPNDLNQQEDEAVLYKAYQDDLGRVITLVIAYGPPLGDSVRLHRPEICYRAQGFSILSRSAGKVPLGAGSVPTVRLSTERGAVREAVTYLLRDGDRFSVNARDHQLQVFRRRGGRADGALVRVSTRLGGAPLFDLHRQFLTAFANALTVEGQDLLWGGAI